MTQTLTTMKGLCSAEGEHKGYWVEYHADVQVDKLQESAQV